MNNYFEEFKKEFNRSREKHRRIHKFHTLIYIIAFVLIIIIIIFNAWFCIKLINSDLPDWLKFLILVKS